MREPLTPLVVLHQQLALLEAPERRGERAGVHREGRDVQQVVEDARDLGEQHADVLAALGRGDAQQLLDGERIGMLLVHRRDVVEPVEVRDRLQVALVLDQLLGAAMQQADMRIAALDDLAVHLDDEAQHAVGRRVLRPEVHRQGLDLDVGHAALALLLGRLRGLFRGLLVARQHSVVRLPTDSGSRSGGTPACSFTGS